MTGSLLCSSLPAPHRPTLRTASIPGPSRFFRALGFPQLPKPLSTVPAPIWTGHPNPRPLAHSCSPGPFTSVIPTLEELPLTSDSHLRAKHASLLQSFLQLESYIIPMGLGLTCAFTTSWQEGAVSVFVHHYTPHRRGNVWYTAGAQSFC